MKYFLNKFQSVLKNRGSKGVLVLVLSYPIKLIKKKTLEFKILFAKSPEKKFQIIFRNNYWNEKETVSGEGSTLDNTENIRRVLPEILSELNIKSIIDVPCGDFKWMKLIINNMKVKYTGGDIVEDLINYLNIKYSNSNISFIKKNIIEDKLEYHDLLIIRDLFVHLPNREIIRVINNFIDSKIPYLLVSNYCDSNESTNPDIQMGFFRNVTLQKEPFNIKEDPKYKIDDSTPFIKRELCLWSREQIVNSVSGNKY